MNIQLFGPEVDEIRKEVEAFPDLRVVESDPDYVVCYGGDGTLLKAERQWPGVPKVPIRNSLRGRRCIPHPPGEVLRRLVEGTLHEARFLKLACTLENAETPEDDTTSVAMNEVTIRNEHVNAAVRYKVWIDDHPHGEDGEIVGDGIIVSTPFGSTAYFHNITQAIFHLGIGIAFVNTGASVSHLIVPEDVVIRIELTRGPAVLAFDNAAHYAKLDRGVKLTIRGHPQPATILAWEPVRFPSESF